MAAAERDRREVAVLPLIQRALAAKVTQGLIHQLETGAIQDVRS